MKDDFRLESKEEFYKQREQSRKHLVNCKPFEYEVSHPSISPGDWSQDPRGSQIQNERWEERCQFLVILGALRNS